MERDALHRGSSAVWLTGPPDTLEIALASGPPRPAPEPSQLVELELPAFCSEAPYGVVALSLLAPRSSRSRPRSARSTTASAGGSATTSASAVRLTAGSCRSPSSSSRGGQSSTRSCRTPSARSRTTLEVLECLRCRALRSSRRRFDDDRRSAERSRSRAVRYRRGTSPSERAQRLSGRVAFDLRSSPASAPNSASRTSRPPCARLYDSLLVLAPPRTARSDLLLPYPTDGRRCGHRSCPARPVDGVDRRSPHARSSLRMERSLRLEPDRYVTAVFDTCRLAIRYPESSRTLLTDDGCIVARVGSSRGNGMPRKAAQARRGVPPVLGRLRLPYWSWTRIVPYGLARGGNARRTPVPIRASSAAGLRLDCSDLLPIFYPTHLT